MISCEDITANIDRTMGLRAELSFVLQWVNSGHERYRRRSKPVQRDKCQINY